MPTTIISKKLLPNGLHDELDTVKLNKPLKRALQQASHEATQSSQWASRGPPGPSASLRGLRPHGDVPSK